MTAEGEFPDAEIKDAADAVGEHLTFLSCLLRELMTDAYLRERMARLMLQARDEEGEA